MRDYGKVAPQFWTGATGKLLRGDAEAQIVALYLMTGPHSRWTGVFRCPILYIAHDTGMGIEGASKALARLIEAGFCLYDEAAEMVFVRNMARYQIGDELKPGDKRVEGIRNEVKEWPQGLIRNEFLRTYNAAFCLGFEVEEQAPSKPLPSPSDAREQRTEEKISRDADASLLVASKADDPLPCPHQRIIALWAEELPELQKVRDWNATRARHLQARWREQAKRRRWQSVDDGVEWFRRLFGYMRQSDFLMGNAPRGPGHEGWVCTLPWLLKAENFAKVIEGNYHRAAA